MINLYWYKTNLPTPLCPPPTTKSEIRYTENTSWTMEYYDSYNQRMGPSKHRTSTTIGTWDWILQLKCIRLNSAAASKEFVLLTACRIIYHPFTPPTSPHNIDYTHIKNCLAPSKTASNNWQQIYTTNPTINITNPPTLPTISVRINSTDTLVTQMTTTSTRHKTEFCSLNA